MKEHHGHEHGDLKTKKSTSEKKTITTKKSKITTKKLEKSKKISKK